jgi:hypothetical protein
MDEICRLNQRVRHCAWKREGTVVDFPFNYTRMSDVTVQWDHKKKPEDVWIPSLRVVEEEEFDWNEDA